MDYGVSTVSTPWGALQHSETIAEGIIRVSTASHGGYILSEPRMAEFEARLTIHFQPFAGYGYFEEDQDWAVIALAFPEFFNEEQIYGAVNTVRHSAQPWKSLPEIHLRWLPIVAWLDEQKGPGYKVQQIANHFRLSRLNYWQVGSMSTSGKGWNISLTRVKDGARQIVKFIDYPLQNFYNDADLIALNISDAS